MSIIKVSALGNVFTTKLFYVSDIPFHNINVFLALDQLYDIVYHLPVILTQEGGLYFQILFAKVFYLHELETIIAKI